MPTSSRRKVIYWKTWILIKLRTILNYVTLRYVKFKNVEIYKHCSHLNYNMLDYYIYYVIYILYKDIICQNAFFNKIKYEYQNNNNSIELYKVKTSLYQMALKYTQIEE